jgi:hypothetical protein
MNKKLTAKTQFLNPSFTENVRSFSNGFVVEPGTPEIALKKGTIYTVFSISGEAAFDVNLINKVAYDILHDTYYQSDNISPIQSLEKSIVDVRDRVTKLSLESIAPDVQPATFSMIAGVLWGNVMYVVQYGAAESYLIRKGEIRPINTIAEGTFSAASGVIKDEDVILLCSKEFGKRYPPEKLLAMAIGDQQLAPQEACILLKFLVDTSFSQNETIDFGLEKTSVAKSIKSQKMTDNILRILKAIKLPKINLGKKRLPRIKPIDTIDIKLRPQRKRIQFKPVYVLPILAIALGISIVYSIKNKHVGTVKPKEVAVKTQETAPTTPEKPQEPDNEIFYDLKITDSTAEPSEISVFSNYVVATDSASGKIYVSDTTTPKFEAEPNTFSKINSLINIKGKLGFVTPTEGYKVYDLANKKVVENYTLENPGIISAYLDYIYELADSKITRYSKEGTALKGSLWAQNSELGNGNSMAIAYSVYVLTQEGKLLKYTSGEKNDFTLKSDPTTLSKPVKVIADIDFDNIYIADSGNKRIAVYSKDGAFIKEYKAKEENRWSNILSIGVSPDEKTLFVLSGSKVYKVVL